MQLGIDNITVITLVFCLLLKLLQTQKISIGNRTRNLLNLGESEITEMLYPGTGLFDLDGSEGYNEYLFVRATYALLSQRVTSVVKYVELESESTIK